MGAACIVGHEAGLADGVAHLQRDVQALAPPGQNAVVDGAEALDIATLQRRGSRAGQLPKCRPILLEGRRQERVLRLR
jgi:hypothetical protein